MERARHAQSSKSKIVKQEVLYSPSERQAKNISDLNQNKRY